MGHPFTGSRCQLASDSAVSGASFVEDNCQITPVNVPSVYTEDDPLIYSQDVPPVYSPCSTSYGASYQAQYGSRLLPSHRQAIQKIVQCRTAALGGHVYHCDTCAEKRYLYHSCRNRHCPQCQHQAGQQWLERQQQMRLGVPYFMLTFTLPSALRPLVRSHQKQLYNLLFRASAAATQQLA
ncbi:MAG: hypothetical protein GY943_36625 [Chloroflexi bacterium]|nr:hypothetical protein [Chloroflexota bacterium]